MWPEYVDALAIQLYLLLCWPRSLGLDELREVALTMSRRCPRLVSLERQQRLEEILTFLAYSRDLRFGIIGLEGRRYHSVAAISDEDLAAVRASRNKLLPEEWTVLDELVARAAQPQPPG